VKASLSLTRESLDALYRKYNKRRFVHPDPLETVYRFASPRDQEIAGLVAALLAYGRVSQILSSVERVLACLGSSPYERLSRASARDLQDCLRAFKHRFTPGSEVAALLTGVKRALEELGSLEALFAAGVQARDESVLPALALFVEKLRAFSGGALSCPSLLSSPADGSACKRLNLYLRWMVRRDQVDPGPWRSVTAAKLVVPLDTHMFKAGVLMGLTARKQPDLRAALEITRGFATLRPRDPVRYDFCITRLEINPDCKDLEALDLLKGSAARPA
jgi:uncharacterized protein (TIGR02757 family)